MTEEDLFAAYRNSDFGYAAQCSCGDWIRSAKGDERSVGSAIRLHNESTVHEQWRLWREALGEVTPAKHPCPCHDHGQGAA